MNICEHLILPAKLFPKRVAIVFEGKRLTYAQIEQQSALAASELQRRGIGRGDRVALVLPNVPAFVVWYYAILRLGAVAVSVSTRLNPKEVAFIVSDCQAKLLVGGDSNSEPSAAQADAYEQDTNMPRLDVSDLGDICDGRRLSDSAQQSGTQVVETAPDEPALILYTSGTTGFAKGATLSHKNVRATVHAFNHLCEMKTEDRILLAVPLFHCYGQNALLNSGFNVGATIVLQQRFDLSESKKLIIDERVNKLFGVPTTFQLLADYCEPSELDSVDYCFSAAATLPIQLSRRWQEKFGMPIFEGYGLTETSPFASYNHRLKFVPGSLGTPVDLVEMKIVDTETGQDCSSGELGEIAIRGPNVMLGYWNRPEDTAQAIRDGWFHSGDIGRVDDDGYFFIVDRVKDMITIGGMKVFPAEVERILLDHAVVREAAVVGLPDEVFGEQAVAFIVRSDTSSAAIGSEPEALKLHCQSHLADYKVPRHFHLVDELPRNPAGKVLKTKLRELARSDVAAARPPMAEKTTPAQADKPDGAPEGVAKIVDAVSPFMQRLAHTHPSARQRELTSLIQSELAEILDEERVPGLTDRLVECGLDSIAIVDLRDRLQQHLGDRIDLPATLIFDYPRICDLAGYLASAVMPEGGTIARTHGPETPEDGETDESVDAIQLADKGVVGSQERGEADTRLAVASMTEEEALDELLRKLKD